MASRRKKLGVFRTVKSKESAQSGAALPRRGTQVESSTTVATAPFMNLLQFTQDQLTEEQNIPPVGLKEKIQKPGIVSWVDVEGLGDSPLVEKVCQAMDLHYLTLEDLQNSSLRPQFECYPGYFFFAINMIYLSNDANRSVITEHISIVLKDQVVLTVQERPGGDVFHRLRDRIRTATSRTRTRGADYLVYSMLDAIVDGYLLVVDDVAARIESLEDEMRISVREELLDKIYDLKKEVLFLRRSIYPVRDLLSKTMVDESVFHSSNRVYLRDLNDHLFQVIESLGSCTEMTAVLLDSWHSLMNQRLNVIMKTLTMISTIFLPLNFIAGIYGMNFEVMPELVHPYGYYFTLGLMAVVAFLMLGIFVHRRWIFENRKLPILLNKLRD